MRFRQIIATAGLIAATFVFGAVSESYAEEARSIVSVGVEGNRYIESAAILERIDSKVGQPLSRKQISRDVRDLFATGFFADVHVEGEQRADGLHLIYVVKENPVITELSIEGNDEVVDKDLKPKLKLKPGRVYSEDLLRRDSATISNAYLKKGFYQVYVTSETEELGDGRINVTLNVEEGQVTRIKQIRFIGNDAFSDNKLRDQLASQESGFASWLSDKDVYNRDRFVADAQMIQMYYLNRGYMDMTVESTSLSLTPDKSSFYLTFALHEGIQYTVADVEVQGDLVPSKEDLLEGVELESGELYSLEKLQKSIVAMTDIVGDEGYAYASVTPLFKRDIASQSVTITFDVEKGREIYIERINIAGNEKTEDKVVRRELRQMEGSRYKATDVRRSKERLKRTYFVEDTRVSFPKGSAPDKASMEIEIDEKNTGSFSAGAGYSQIEKLFLTAKVEENNLFGKGYTTNLSADVGAKTQNFTGNFMDSYFLDSNVGLSLSAYKNQTELIDYTGYKQNSWGAGAGFVFPLTEFMAYSIGYKYDRTNLFGIPANASLILRSQLGIQTTGEVSHSISWDTRDRVIATSSGHQELLKVNVAGLGGENRFFEGEASTSHYFELGDNYVLNPKLAGKYIRAYSGREVPIYRRYSMGGAGSLRGFDSYGVSLRDPVSQDAIGGDRELKASLNLFFPIPYMETSGFRGVMFADAGLVWGSVKAAIGNQRISISSPFSSANIRSSLGLGIEWMSPVGPINLIWGYPVRTLPGDIKRNFEFAIGTGF